jgi:hypothetical protein
MFPKYYLRYTFSTPLYLFAIFVTGYILGRMRISFMPSLYKLILILSMLLVLKIIISWAIKKYRMERIKRRILRFKNELKI